MNIAEKEGWEKFNYKEVNGMTKMTKNLNNVFEELHPGIILPEEEVHIELWTNLEPIEKYYIVSNYRRTQLYRVRRYTDQPVCEYEAEFASLYMAIRYAEKLQYCTSMEIIDGETYKDVLFVNF